MRRVLLGGRTAVPQAAQVALRRDALVLAKSFMPEACARLGAIAQALCERRADGAVAQAWMVGAFYERAGRRGI